MDERKPTIDDVEDLPVEVPAEPAPVTEEPGKAQPANGGWSSQDRPIPVN